MNNPKLTIDHHNIIKHKVKYSLNDGIEIPIASYSNDQFFYEDIYRLYCSEHPNEKDISQPTKLPLLLKEAQEYIEKAQLNLNNLIQILQMSLDQSQPLHLHKIYQSPTVKPETSDLNNIFILSKQKAYHQSCLLFKQASQEIQKHFLSNSIYIKDLQSLNRLWQIKKKFSKKSAWLEINLHISSINNHQLNIPIQRLENGHIFLKHDESHTNNDILTSSNLYKFLYHQQSKWIFQQVIHHIYSSLNIPQNSDFSLSMDYSQSMDSNIKLKLFGCDNINIEITENCIKFPELSEHNQSLFLFVLQEFLNFSISLSPIYSSILIPLSRLIFFILSYQSILHQLLPLLSQRYAFIRYNIKIFHSTLSIIFLNRFSLNFICSLQINGPDITVSTSGNNNTDNYIQIRNYQHLEKIITNIISQYN